MMLDEPDMATWKNPSTYADSNGAGISRGQTDRDNFGYTLAASVEGAKFTTSVINTGTNGSKVRLTITPSSSYTIWIANATRINAPGHDSVAQAKKLLTDIKNTGYATTLSNYKDWWHNFWKSSFVQYSNAAGDADYIENFSYLSEYITAGGAFGNYPFQHMNGTYSSVRDDDASNWCGGYWYWNQRDVYAPFLQSNHPEVLDSFFNLYLRNIDTIKAHTKERFGVDGAWVPETIGWDGNARHTDESDFTKYIYSTGVEACHYMYTKYLYTNDIEWLKKIYPLMKEVTVFYSNMFTKNSTTGKYEMLDSNSHETYWRVKNALTDLASVNAFFPMVIDASKKLNQDSDLRSKWQDILDNIQPYATDANGFLPCDPPVPSTHNNENIACELVWPYDLIGVGSPKADLDKAIWNWNNRPKPYVEIWEPDAIQAARLGLGDSALTAMKTMLTKFTNYPNGRYWNNNGNFEPNGVNPAAVNESLMQSWSGKIRVFPAIPSDTSFVGKFTLAAKGGFLVSSEREASETKYIGIKSLYGNPVTVVNPWNEQVQVINASDNSLVTTAEANNDITFNTDANAVYVIQRTSKPLSSYSYEQITSTANQGEKTITLSGKTARLGSNSAANSGGAVPTSVTGKVYEAESGELGGNAVVIADPQASNNGAVSLSSVGDSVYFSNTVAASQLNFGYCTTNNPGKLSLYVNGTHTQDISFTYNGASSGGYAFQTAPVSIPAGASVKLQLDSDDSATTIDNITFIYLDLSGVSIDLTKGQITGTTIGMEYSLDSTDGSNGTWTTASAGNTPVTFKSGNVYIRETANHNNFRLLATIPYLSAITVDGQPLAGFSSGKTTYSVALPRSYTGIPVIAATTGSASNMAITQAAALPGVAKVVVSSSLTTVTYSIYFGYPPKSTSFMDGTMDSDWTIVSSDPSAYSLVPGLGLRLPTQQNDIYGSGSGWKNVFVTQAAGDWDVESAVYLPVLPSANYQQQSLLAWQDDNNYVKVDMEYSGGLKVQLSQEVAGSAKSIYTTSTLTNVTAPMNIYYRITRAGDNYTGYYSLDGINFTKLGTATVPLTNTMIGIFATENATSTPVDTYCQYIKVLSGLSGDATLKGININGTPISNFASDTLNYDVVLPAGTQTVPTVQGIANDFAATVINTDATKLPGTTTIKVTAADGTTRTYTINFTVAEATPAAALACPASVQPGNSFTVGISLNNLKDSVYAQDITLTYDSNIFEYVSSSGASSNIQIVKEDKSDGKVRLIAANIGGVSGASNQVLNVNFKAKDVAQNTTGNIAITQAKLGVAPQGTVIQAALDSKSILVGTVITVDKTKLAAAISDAETLRDSAVVGTEPGQYPQAAKDTFAAAIEAAKGVLNNNGATQAEVDSAVTALSSAEAAFKASVIQQGGGENVDKTALTAAISDAEALYNSSTAGNLPGQYPQAAKDALNTAIGAAKAVLDDSSATQSQVDRAVTSLKDAVNTFKEAIVKEVSADLNKDGSIDVGDLAIVAYYYGKDSTGTDWETAKIADMNNDNMVDISDLAYVASKIKD